jgi:hypothetical protein
MNDHYYTDEWRDEMRADAHQPKYDELADFAKDNPLDDYKLAAALSILACDDQQCRLTEDHGFAVMRYLVRQFAGGEGLPANYDTDQRVRDEGAISHWLAGAIENRCIELQRQEWERS